MDTPITEQDLRREAIRRRVELWGGWFAGQALIFAAFAPELTI